MKRDTKNRKEKISLSWGKYRLFLWVDCVGLKKENSGYNYQKRLSMSELLYAKLLVSIQFLSMGLMLLFSDGIFDHPLALIVFTLGLSIGIWALLHNKLGNFNIQPKLKENAKLITTGVYKYIRHPMYFSVVLMMLGLLIATPTLYELLLFLLLLTVLYLKAKKEESLWIKENPDYVAYKERSKYFIPFVL